MLTTIQRLNFYLRIISFWKIPLLFYCRPKIILLTDQKVQFKIKLKRRVKNHLGSMYLGALAVGADLASGYFAFHYLQKHKKSISLIFKDFHADFYRRSMDDGVFTCDMGLEIKELIDNSVDEVLAGYCTDIEVKLFADGSCSVEDNGRGIPIGMQKEMQKEKK